MSLSSTIRATVKEVYAPLNRSPSGSDLLQFGMIVLVGMGLLGVAFHYRLLGWMQAEHAGPMWIVGGAVMLLSLIPPIGRLLYILWMGLGLSIGFFTAPVIMFVVYTLVIVPVGLVFKLTKRDTMRRGLDPKARSYWEDYPGSDDPASYIRQF